MSLACIHRETEAQSRMGCGSNVTGVGGAGHPLGAAVLVKEAAGDSTVPTSAQSHCLHPLGPGLVAEARAQRPCSAFGGIVIPGACLLPPKIPPT